MSDIHMHEKQQHPARKLHHRYGLLLGAGGTLLFLIVLASLLAARPDKPSVPQFVAGDAVVARDSALLESGGSAPLRVGDVAPDFSYTLDDGTTHRLSDLRGQKVMINFWATWCPPCRAEMPDIQEAATRYADQGFVVLAVNSGEEVALVEAFAQEFGLTIPLIANPSGDISNAYGARGLPTSYFINTDGTIGFRQVGMVSTETIAARLEGLQ